MKKFLSNKIALGTAQFGLDYGINNSTGKISKKEVFEILKYAHKKGINLLDTSYAYGDSEIVLGEYFKKNKTKFQIVSKLPGNKNGAEVFYESLTRLNIDNMYGYLIHNFDLFLKKPGVWKNLKELKKQNKVKKIGFSLYYPEELEYLLKKNIRFNILQVPYNVFDQRFSLYFPGLKKRGVEIHARSVFLQGLVFKKNDELPRGFLKIKNRLDKLRFFSMDLKIPISAICLNFAAANSFVDKVIMGIDNIGNLKENLRNLKYKEKIKKIYDELLEFKENDENIILPINWKIKK